MKYSVDLRERVITFIERGGGKLEASRMFSVSRSAIDAWIKLKKETGSLKSPPLPPRAWRKLCPKALERYVEAQPDAFLSSYASHFNVSITGVWTALNRLNITRKKRQRFTESALNKNAKNTSIK
jgi:transposase